MFTIHMFCNFAHTYICIIYIYVNIFQVTPATVTGIFQQIKGKRNKDVQSVQAHGSASLPPQEVLD